jgi:hypothetical protein
LPPSIAIPLPKSLEHTVTVIRQQQHCIVALPAAACLTLTSALPAAPALRGVGHAPHMHAGPGRSGGSHSLARSADAAQDLQHCR